MTGLHLIVLMSGMLRVTILVTTFAQFAWTSFYGNLRHPWTTVIYCLKDKQKVRLFLFTYVPSIKILFLDDVFIGYQLPVGILDF